MSLELFHLYYVYLECLECLEYAKGDRPDLDPEDRKRRDRRIPRIALKTYKESSFFYLYSSGNDQALLNCCGVDHKTFRELLDLFEPVYNLYTRDKGTRGYRMKDNKGGRPRTIDAIGGLGLVLYWYRTRGSCARSVAWCFGMCADPMYTWLKYSKRVLLHVLQHHPDAKIVPPTGDEIQEYADAISAKHAVLKEQKVWAAIDGLKLKLQASKKHHVQNMFYNGWADGTYINCCFVFAPNGKIPVCIINAPGTMHDSTMAEYGIYQKLEDLYDKHKCRVVVDSAFKLGDKNKPYLLKSAQNLKPTEAIAPNRYALNEAATSVRQLAEHGMRMIQGQFPRLKDNMPFQEFDADSRRVDLHLMVLLYNFQTAKIGINQILNTFMSKTKGFKSYQYVLASGEPYEVSATAEDVWKKKKKKKKKTGKRSSSSNSNLQVETV